MKNTVLAGVAITLLLSSAAVTARELTTAEKNIIVNAAKDELKDPDSAKFFWQDYKGGEIYCAHVNAKNSYGGFTGKQLMIIGLKSDKSGKIVHSDVSIYNSADAEFMGKMCTEYGYTP